MVLLIIPKAICKLTIYRHSDDFLTPPTAQRTLHPSRLYSAIYTKGELHNARTIPEPKRYSRTRIFYLLTWSALPALFSRTGLNFELGVTITNLILLYRPVMVSVQVPIELE
jgi:hypothetical protein